MASWFDTSKNGVITPTSPTIESDNGGKISFAAVQNGSGMYVAVIYDASASATPQGKKGDAVVAVTRNGIACGASDFVVAVDPADVALGSPVSLSWQPCCEDGFVVGPFSAGEQACFTHSGLVGVSTARFVDGTNTDTAIAANASTGEICIVFS